LQEVKLLVSFRLHCACTALLAYSLKQEHFQTLVRKVATEEVEED
jgi:hypothetical protein